ncbi:serine/threonine-protein kinase [Mycolicibacterium sp. Y3]
MTFSVGSVVAGYTIEGILGSGGMGTVYKARHPRLPRSDALKVLSAELSRDEMFRVRFQREADLAASLDHPNIVTIYNRGETEDGQLWIAMQYVAGSDADQEVRAGNMTARRAVRIVTAVADALDYAHSRDILHRDIKPANFLLAEDDHRIFLADFGIARAIDEAVGLTQTGQVMTSVAYAAPEALAGNGVDHRADIYALGCSLFRMVVGKTPFAKPEGGIAATAAAHLTEAPPRATTFIPNLPPAIDAVFSKALAKDPNQRYQSARALADAASAALSGNTTQQWTTHPPAPQLSVPHHSGPPRVDTQWAAPTAAHYSDATTQARTWHDRPGSGGDPAVAARFSAVPPAKGRRRLVVGGAIAAVVVVVALVAGFLLFRGGDDQSVYAKQTFTHAHGSTDLTARPNAVAALGPGDAAAVLALGVQPVAIGSLDPKLPSWEQSAVTGQPAVLSGFTDTAAVAAVKPDVIIATGDLDDATYQKLAAIAPTITRPTDTEGANWNWQAQQKWVGRILGEQNKAETLVKEITSQQEDLRNQNAAFTGKTVEAIAVSDEGVGAVLTPTFASNYLDSLGFKYNSELSRGGTDAGGTRPLTDLQLRTIETDVLVIIRTDSKAGQGGYGGLPSQLRTYQGISVIVDDPNSIAALQDPGGYLASRYLSSTLVPQLGQLIK